MNKLYKVVFVVLLFIVGISNRGFAASLAGVDIDSLAEWEVVASSSGGKLLLSDSPEMVATDGILYQDTVTGKNRLFFYHVNDAKCAKDFDVVIENEGMGAATVVVDRYGLGGPGYEWMAVGKEAVTAYFAGSKPYKLSLPPGAAVSLAAVISETAVLPNMLINGIFDFTADKPVKIKVIMKPLFTDSDQFLRTATVLPADYVHLRGTFAGADRRIMPKAGYDPLSDGIKTITLADNRIDRYLQGIDATDGSEVVNYGNYGVVYEVVIPALKGESFACYLSPRGGHYAGAVGLKYRQTAQETIETPADRLFFGGVGTNHIALLGVFDGSVPLCVNFSPPGGSNLPAKIIIVPQ